MQAVCETHHFRRAAAEAGMTAGEVAALKTFLSENPLAGDVIVGTGGARKVRFAKSGHGKSGGYRVITYYGGDDIPVFLMDVYAKGDKTNLSAKERNALRGMLETFAHAYREGVRGRVVALKRKGTTR
jgi:hypothetical protein